MKIFNAGDTLSLYGETVAISKVEQLVDTQLIYWHSQNSPLCGLKILTEKSEKNITFNLK
ncbi:hypothetical protein GW756_02945 [bacterium]|nr:hypothetical protein [bacterium]NCQ55525.1 hypothetical protein [Candidatus Parcubacteria bacterium]NCS67536.1 hypothetical protein [Candidatus Peregrinibacteria bacterium]NCS96299.1 hypothetical protein [bacterium]